MFYKQRVLANFWGRKDSAICASRKRSGHYYTIIYVQVGPTSMLLLYHYFLATFDTWLN